MNYLMLGNEPCQKLWFKIAASMLLQLSGWSRALWGQLLSALTIHHLELSKLAGSQEPSKSSDTHTSG